MYRYRYSHVAYCLLPIAYSLSDVFHSYVRFLQPRLPCIVWFAWCRFASSCDALPNSQQGMANWE